MVDTPPAITDAIRAVVALADLVLIPVKPSPHDLARSGERWSSPATAASRSPLS